MRNPGIYYCFVKGFDEMVFAVSPENLSGEYVHPIARSFTDIPSLLLACGSMGAIEQAHMWDEAAFDGYAVSWQRSILEKYAKDNHLPNPQFFFDDGYSGVTFTRPAFMKIMELAEQGLVANLVVKDHSRLGRNRLVVGQLLEEDFVRLNVRYIAIMDNIDTANGVSDIVPMQDLFKNKCCLGGVSAKALRINEVA